DLHNGRLRLLQNQLLIDRPNLCRLFKSLAAANLVFLGSGHGDVVLAFAHASGIIGIDDQGVFVIVEADALALGIDLVLAVGLIPLGDGGVFVHIFND